MNPLLDQVLKEPSERPPVKVRLDWRAYFRKFSEMHGGNPVICRGRLLFEDGWMYSATDHAGPEWPPPDNPEALRQLLRFYWTSRLRIVSSERDQLRRLVDTLEEIQQSKSAPLQHKAIMMGDDGRVSFQSRNLDLLGHRKRLEWLDRDVEVCEQQLRDIESSQILAKS